MFGLYSDLDQSKWEESAGKPPANKNTMEGYEYWGITRVVADGDHIKYFLTSAAGGPNQGVLYGAERNPLKDVGHCRLKLVERQVGCIVTGMCVEDDWVVMKEEYLNTFKVKTEEDRLKEKEEEEEEQTVDMSIYSDLQPNKWKKMGKPPRQKAKLGYEFYDVIRCESDGSQHQFKLFLCSSQGEQVEVTLEATLRNAFHSITRGYFKIEKGFIKGIIVEDDWVEMK